MPTWPEGLARGQCGRSRPEFRADHGPAEVSRFRGRPAGIPLSLRVKLSG